MPGLILVIWRFTWSDVGHSDLYDCTHDYFQWQLGAADGSCEGTCGSGGGKEASFWQAPSDVFLADLPFTETPSWTFGVCNGRTFLFNTFVC